MRVIYLAFLLLSGCAGTHKVFETKTRSMAITIRGGNYRGIEYLTIVSNDRKGHINDYSLDFYCECNYVKQALTKKYKNFFWKAVTDTVPEPIFYGIPIYKASLVKPISFLPITAEELEQLKIAIEKSGEDCCINSLKPVDKIIGFVKTTLR